MNSVMPVKSKSAFLCVMVTFLIIFAVSCKKDDSDPISDSEHLVESSLILTYQLSTIQVLMTAQMILYPEIADIISHLKYDVEVYRIKYKTIYRDSVVMASGLACIPATSGSFPVMSFQNGTNTLHDNAPTVDPTSSGYAIMEFMTSTGYVVLMTDYIGFGASEEIVHPYYHRNSTNNAVIDLIKAFRELGETGRIRATANDSLFLLGYSQGGGATISALDAIENGNALDMEVIAVSAGAGAYDLIDFTNYVRALDNFPAPLYFPYFVYAHQQVGTISNPLSTFFNEPYAAEIPGLFDGTLGNNSINDSLSTAIADLLTPALITDFETADEYEDLRDALTDNSIYGWETEQLVNLYHGTTDDNVPPGQSLTLYNEFIAEGSHPDLVHHYPLEGLGHGAGLLPWGIQTMNWFNSLKQ